MLNVIVKSEITFRITTIIKYVVKKYIHLTNDRFVIRYLQSVVNVYIFILDIHF